MQIASVFCERGRFRLLSEFIDSALLRAGKILHYREFYSSFIKYFTQEFLHRNLFSTIPRLQIYPGILSYMSRIVSTRVHLGEKLQLIFYLLTKQNFSNQDVF